ncbi:MAG: c-type cytochrome, partial [Dehalococcoidia bacterium]|nr:c-type cytochrome [Dehalococcoidia bacterium]
IAGVALAVAVLTLTAGAHAENGDIALRKALYEKECVICHQVDGNGKGPAARFLDPKPRDFTTGVFKIRSTTFLATDEDLFGTITRGMPGTLMPSFAHLSEEERWALVTHVKGFSEEFEETESLDPITIPDPLPRTAELMALGQQLYVDAGCLKCHGKAGKGDGTSSKTLTDRWGEPILPYDFTIPGKMKGGPTGQDVYRTLVVGIGGTPMPAYDFLTEEEAWALTYYTLSLAHSDAEPLPEGDPDLGRDLLMGVTAFENGGPPCMGCHGVMGINAFGGGPWGPDLTTAHQKFKEDGLATFLEVMPFPTMGPLYRPRPLSEEERGHVLAFLRGLQLTGVQAAIATVPPLYTSTILMGVLGVISLTFAGLIAGRKKVEVRQ